MLNNRTSSEVPDRREEPLRVLIVEDSPRDAELEVATLMRAGYLVRHEVAPTEEIFRQLLSQGDFDVILADYNLQSWTGLDALDILKKSGKDIPVVIVTGSLGDETAVECIKEGAADYVLKDRVARLPLAVRRVLKEKELLKERTTAQEALRQSEERFRSLIANSSDVICLVSREGRITFASPSITRILGYSTEELMGQDGFGFVHPGDLERVKAVFREALQTPQRVTRIEYRFRHRDGSYRWIEVYSQNLLDHPSVQSVIVNSRDITARKIAEENLRDSEEQFRLISENVDDLIAVVDLEGKRLYNSPSYKKVLGDPEMLRGTFSLKEIHPEDREKVREVFQKTVRTGIGQRAEFRFQLRDGTIRYVESQGSVIHDGHGRASRVVVVSRDITERKSLENQLIQSQKMEAVGRLAGGVAHDFNNLLTVIMGFSELLREQLDPESTSHAHAAEILKASGRAAMLTRQLLAFSRKQVLAPQVLHLNTVVADMDKMLRRLIREDIELHSNFGQELGLVKADPGQSEQIILNLVVNARDAMPNGGRLTIETANVDLDQSFTQRHMNITPGRYVMLAVSDTGTGMDAETQSHIFEPFFTTKPEGKGTGIGLATVYGIVRQSGGSIWVYSELGKGTTFKVYFPRVDETAKVMETFKAPSTSCAGEETILLVEDENSVRALAKMVLQQKGFTVIEAHHGEEALRLARKHAGPIHLLVSDVVMPGISGREVAGEIGTLHPGVKVLFMSGYTDDAVIRHGILESGTAFLQKPFTPESLVRKVREVLDQAA